MHISNVLIFENRWLCLISISSEKFEFDEYKMYLDVEIVAPSMLLYNSKFNNFSEYYVRCHFLIPPWLHNSNFIDIWMLVDYNPLYYVFVWYVRIMIAMWLLIVKTANENRGNIEKWRHRKIMKTEEIKKEKEEKLDTWYFILKPRNWILKLSQIYSIHNSCDLQKFCY